MIKELSARDAGIQEAIGKIMELKSKMPLKDFNENIDKLLDGAENDEIRRVIEDRLWPTVKEEDQLLEMTKSMVNAICPPELKGQVNAILDRGSINDVLIGVMQMHQDMVNNNITGNE